MNGLSTLKGKVAVITGGASGIGKGIAKQMIAEGAKVVIADIEEKALEKTAGEIGAFGVKTDVSDLNSVQNLADTVVSKFGTVHIICNNAGVAPKAKIIDTTIDDWRWMIGVNLWGVIYGVKVFLPILLKNPDGGHIVNTSSAGGLIGGPTMGIYNTTKAGVIALSQTLAQELQEEESKVGVTVFCPGTIRTKLHTASRNRPEEFARIGAVDVDLLGKPGTGAEMWMPPDKCGPIVTAAIKRNDLFVTTHSFIAPMYMMRAEEVVESFERGSALFHDM